MTIKDLTYCAIGVLSVLGFLALMAANPLNNPTDFTGISITATDLDLTDTDAGAGAGPEINLHRDSSSPATSDLIGQIDFEGEEATSSTLSLFGRIGGILVDATENSVDGALFFSTTGAGTGGENGLAEAMRILPTQDVLIGHTAIIPASLAELQVSTVTNRGGLAMIANSEADTTAANVEFFKGGNASRGSAATIVADNEVLGRIQFFGSDGSNFDRAALIFAEIDGSPSSGTDMPGALVFSTTPEAAGSPTERMRIDSAGRISSITNTGTAGVGVSILEFGDGFNHVTRIDLGTAVFPSITGDTAQAVGFLAYTFPAGVIYIDAIHMDVAIDGVTAIQGDTPDVGLGTVIATGGVSVLGGTATFEDWINGTAAADANGTNTDVTTIPNVSTLIVLEASEVHLVHFNAADLWDDASGGDATPDLSGQIWIAWRFLGA